MMKAGLNKVRMPRVLIPKVHLPYVGWHSDLSGGPMWRKLKKDMVLWYDLKKQGATNESMAENPVLRDLSGNGHDATCYNFAWSGMSGVGGYADSYINPHWYIENRRVTATKTEAKINVTGILSKTISIYYQSSTGEQAYLVPSYKIKVIGLTDGQSITYRDSDNTVTFMISNDGEYTLPEINFGAVGKFYGFTFNKLQDSCNITIEQLPLYPNALVSDGVDDYCLVEGLRYLNKDDGYTVIAKRKYLTGIRQSCLASKRNSDQPDGAFVFELQSVDWYRVDSFGYQNNMVQLEESDISYQTSKSYNGKAINVGEASDNNVLRLLNLRGNYLANVAFYSFLLFDRDLSTDEIEWVKTNLMS